ncbi:hypothetical protein YC2023_066649 [Brassica napus]
MEKSKHKVSMLPTTNTQRTYNRIIDPKLAVASSVQNHLRDETSVQKPHGDVYLDAVPVPETFRGRVLHGDSTGTAWGRLENLVMNKTSFHGT